MKNSKVLVIGLGKSGVSAVNTLYEIGSKVYVYDGNVNKISKEKLGEIENKTLGIFSETKDADDKFLESLDFIVVSPGVPLTNDICLRAKSMNKKIIGELELAYIVGKGKFIGITGTNGKTTTTTLVGEIFKKAGLKTEVVGNIGKAVAEVALKSKEDEYLVTEISSFQLETIEKFKPEVCTILNLTEDHLDRHGNMTEYGNAKARIFENLDENGFLVVNYEDELSFDLSKKCKKGKIVAFSSERKLEEGIFVDDGNIKVKIGDEDFALCKTEDIRIRGKHNLENALVSVGIAHCAGIDRKYIVEVLKEFEGVEHRLEPVCEVEGVEFVNDSKGTNTDAAMKAIEALEKNIILIAGGYNKGADFKDFIKNFNGRVKALVLLGETAEKIKSQALEVGFDEIFIEGNMKNCVDKALELSKKGDKVLLSPACASWDMYKNYEERGKDFKNLVKKLNKSK